MTAFSSPDLKAFPLTLQVFQIFRGRSRARLCLSCLSSSARHVGHHPPQLPPKASPASRRLAIARINIRVLVVLSDCLYLWRKDPHLPSHPHPSATCRALRACHLWHLWPVSASALQTRKPPPNTTGPIRYLRPKPPAYSDRHPTPGGRAGGVNLYVMREVLQDFRNSVSETLSRSL